MRKTIWVGVAWMLAWSMTIGCAGRRPFSPGGGSSMSRNDLNQRGKPPQSGGNPQMASFPNTGQPQSFGPGGLQQMGGMNAGPMHTMQDPMNAQQTPIATSLQNGRPMPPGGFGGASFGGMQTNEPMPVSPTNYTNGFNVPGREPPPNLQKDVP